LAIFLFIKRKFATEYYISKKKIAIFNFKRICPQKLTGNLYQRVSRPDALTQKMMQTKISPFVSA
jgi:hypothetical protein